MNIWFGSFLVSEFADDMSVIRTVFYLKGLVDDLKGIVSRLSEMKYSMQTNKPLKPLSDNADDVLAWNNYFQEQQECTGEPPSWYSSTWLYVECFFYRKIHEAITLR